MDPRPSSAASRLHVPAPEDSMQRVSDVLGKPVVSAATGEKVGKVADVLLDPAVTRIVGLVVSGGLFSGEHVLAYEDVQTVGRDAVIARSTDGSISAKEWRKQAVETTRWGTLLNRRVMTAGGRQLGAVKDLQIDEARGEVQGYDIAASALGGLSERHTLVPRSGGITIGPDAIILPDGGTGGTTES
jgi:uncharacterized protein YrrD